MGLRPVAGPPVINNINTILWFGRYRGCLLKDILLEDPAYLVWAQDSIEGFDLSHELFEIAERGADAVSAWEIYSEFFWREKKIIWD